MQERPLVKRIGIMERLSNFLWGIPPASEVETYGFSPKRAQRIRKLAEIIGVDQTKEEPKGAVLDAAEHTFARIIALEAEGYSIYAIDPAHEQILQKYGTGTAYKFASVIASEKTQEAREYFGLSRQD